MAAENQQDEDTIQRLTQLEADVRGRYYNFRAEVDDRPLSDNELDEVLARSGDSELVREAWEASRQVGGQVADMVRELARTRNAAALTFSADSLYFLGPVYDPKWQLPTRNAAYDWLP